VLTSSKALAEFFEDCLKEYNNPKAVSNWVMGELLRILNDKGLDLEHIKFPPVYLAELLRLVENSTISGTAAKQVLETAFENGMSPSVVIKELGLEQISDRDAILRIIRKIVAENPESVKAYKEGKDKVMSFLVGQSMRALNGKGNPQIINKIIKEMLNDI
jgi:aspartyl-tRNA(Asn)/glutamyl-tRNA(Gln) amidotransferase subunit B